MSQPANRPRAPNPRSPKVWLQQHLQVALASLGRLTRTPLATLMTATVIGIALALPAGLYVLLHNLERLTGSWEISTSITLFLQQDVGETAAEALLTRLQEHPGVAHVEYTSPVQAMAEFRRLSGFAEALDMLAANPLPAVVAIQPSVERSTPEAAQALRNELSLLPEVEVAQLDLHWLQRFRLITEVAVRVVLVLATFLGIAVVLIVGNTIRLEIQNRRTEIEITKMIGATEAFIRRPFLYAGFWYGVIGGTLAWLLLLLALSLLAGPVNGLARLYQSEFELSLMPLPLILVLLGGSALLGLGGSWIAVQRHLRAIEPGALGGRRG